MTGTERADTGPIEGLGGPHTPRGDGGDLGAAAPELKVCAEVQPLIGWDRVSVVAAAELDHRLPLPGSDAVLHRFGDLQQSLAQGPGADVLSTGIPVLVDDLRVPVERWTLLLASNPASFPVRSLAALPLVTTHRRRHRETETAAALDDSASSGGPLPGGTCAGATAVDGVLCVARDHAQPFTVDQVQLLEALAALVAAMLQHRAAAGDLFASASRTTGGSGSDSTTISGEEVAVVVGMLRGRLGVDEFEASAWLRAHAFAIGATMHEVARAVLSGRTALDDVIASP